MSDNDSKNQAIAQVESIVDLHTAYKALSEDDSVTSVFIDGYEYKEREEIEELAQKKAQSVEVRTGWYAHGQSGSDVDAAEFRIVLCFGGPNVELRGSIGSHDGPEDVEVYHSWATHWERLHYGNAPDGAIEAVEWYASMFIYEH